MFLRFTFFILGLWTCLLHSAAGATTAATLQWSLPIATDAGKPLLQSKFSGPQPGLWLELSALQKVQSPADGTLLYSGAISASKTGFVIGHPNGWVSLLESSLSWERVANLAIGSEVRQGQELAVMRGGRPEILRQLHWSIYQLDDPQLLQELKALPQDRNEAGSAVHNAFWARLVKLPAVNAKDLLNLGSLQFSLHAGSELEDCSLRFVGLQLPCRSAEQNDYLLPVGVHKIEVLSGRIFKSTNTTASFVSKADTIVQRIEKDDRNNYLAAGYSIDRTALTAAPPASDTQALAQAQAELQAQQLEQDRQVAAAEILKRQKETEASAQAQKLEQERQLAAAESQRRQAEALAQAQKLEQEKQLAAAESQRRQAEALAQAQKQERERQLAAAESQRRQKEAEALAQAQKLEQERQLAAAESQRRQAEALAQAQKLEQERQLAAAESQRRQKEAEALAQAQKLEQERQLAAAESQRRQAEALAQAQKLERERQLAAAETQRRQAEALAQEARQRDEREILRVNAELSKLKEQLSQFQAQKPPTAELPSSAPTRGSGARRALIMGNDSYKEVAVLQNARSDARAMSKTLGRLGFEVTTHLDLTERGMKEAIRTFKSQIRGGDEVLVFFAGHGVQLGATNYLLPVDIRGQSEEQVRDEAIPLQRLLDDFQDTKARFALAIIDACRDNPFKTAGRAIGGRGLASTSAATGQMVMFSAGTGQQALDRLGPQDKEPHGLFTRVLLKEIDKPGVSIERLVRNVRNEVARLSKTVGHEQVPAVYDQTLGDFFFKP